MVSVLFINDDELLATRGTVRKLLDPACGTGGMLAEARSYLHEHHPDAKLYVYGQDYNKRAFATAASDMLMKEVSHSGGGDDNVRFGDSFTEDGFDGETYDYFLTNPSFGVDWKRQQSEIRREHEKRGFAGRFGAGLPRVNDGALLFLLHMVAKFEPVRPHDHHHGSRLAIVFSGSSLFTGGAGSGESNIRRWIIENDWLEAIIALPEQMFYNTGIGTYVWIVTNRKVKRRHGRIQLVDARDLWTPGGSAESRRSLGDKRRHLSDDQIDEIVRLYGRLEDEDRCKTFRQYRLRVYAGHCGASLAPAVSGDVGHDGAATCTRTPNCLTTYRPSTRPWVGNPWMTGTSCGSGSAPLCTNADHVGRSPSSGCFAMRSRPRTRRPSQ